MSWWKWKPWIPSSATHTDTHTHSHTSTHTHDVYFTNDNIPQEASMYTLSKLTPEGCTCIYKNRLNMWKLLVKQDFESVNLYSFLNHFIQNSKKKLHLTKTVLAVLKRKGRVRRMAPWLRADTAQTQDPSLISGSCIRDTQLPTIPAAEDPTHSSGL